MSSLKIVYSKNRRILELGYVMLIIREKQNCEGIINPDGSLNTAYTTNSVPLIHIDPTIMKIKDRVLGDNTQTVLIFMGIYCHPI